MTKANGLFQAGLSWNIGDGTKINLWNDNWLPNHNCLCKTIQVLLPHKEEQLTVSSILSNHSWLLDRLSLSLHPDTVAQINHIYISFSTNKPDQSFWNQTSLGNFTSKSAYLLQLQITNQLSPPTPANHSKLWHLKCLNKLKFFL